MLQPTIGPGSSFKTETRNNVMCSPAPVHNMKLTERILLALSILQNISRPSPQGTQGIILG